MKSLQSLECPGCHRPIPAVTVDRPVPLAASYDDCIRRCEACGIGVSNTSHSETVTYIHRDPLGNIPSEIRENAAAIVGQALNARSRLKKWQRFGFSTSEDAVTWVVFIHLLRAGQLLDVLRHVGLLPLGVTAAELSLLLWGVPVGADSRTAAIREALIEFCTNLNEDPQSFSEPDVIIDLGPAGLMFVEVKYLSGNDMKAASYPGWERYIPAPGLRWNEDAVKSSGCYELARNWRLLTALADKRPATLVNLGPTRLFAGAEGRRLDSFADALACNQRLRFVKLTWPNLLTAISNAPVWFQQFCAGRNLHVANR